MKSITTGLLASVFTLWVPFAASGEPANDMLGAGVYGYYRLIDGWFIGTALDSASYDFERPYRLLGLSSNEIDTKANSTAITAWIERRYDASNRRLSWFWGAGAGFNSTDVDDVSGPTTGGARSIS